MCNWNNRNVPPVLCNRKEIDREIRFLFVPNVWGRGSSTAWHGESDYCFIMSLFPDFTISSMASCFISISFDWLSLLPDILLYLAIYYLCHADLGSTLWKVTKPGWISVMDPLISSRSASGEEAVISSSLTRKTCWLFKYFCPNVCPLKAPG